MSARVLSASIAVVLFTTGVGAEPVDFTLPDLRGHEIRLSDYRGRWVVINFWASWCAPCVAEIPIFIAFQQAHPQSQVIGINFEQTSAAETEAFLRRFAINYPNLAIGDEPLVPFEPLDGLPTTVFVDPNGEIAGRHLGQVTLKLLEATVNQAQHDTPGPSTSATLQTPALESPR